MERVLSNKLAIALFVLPGLLIYLGIVLIPIGWSIIYSFYEGIPGIKFTFNGIHNYLKMVSDQQFLASFLINLKYVGIVALGEVGFGLLLALLFGFGIKKHTALVRTITFLPVVLPVVAVGQLFSKIYDIVPQYGLLNSLLHLLSLDSLIQPWIGIPSTALYALCVQDIWRGVGFYAVIFFAALLNIPSETIEAARIDGAQRFSLARYILLPMLRPMITTAFILSFSGTLKVFSSAMALTRGGPGTATKMLTMHMFDTAFTYGEYGYGSAIAVFILLECFLVTFIINRFFARKEID